MKKKRPSEGVISNKRARFDYELDDPITVGIALNGRETKSLRLGLGQLKGAYVTVKDNELWLINAHIPGNRAIPIEEPEVTQARKLLTKRREIDELIERKNNGKTILPLELLTKGRYIKLRIASGRGKRQYDKRASIKKRDDSRNTARELKGRY